jgi:hypothetical protein
MNTTFMKLDLFPYSGGKVRVPTQLGPLGRHQSLGIETDPVSETFKFFSEY